MATQHSSVGKGRLEARAAGAKESRDPNPLAIAGAERDEVYGLISVLYHALQGAETYARYGEDARSAGDDELVEFFEECQDEEVDRAERAKELLAARLDTYADDAEDDDDDDEVVDGEGDEDIDEER
jgi:hypothetical protein